MSRDRITTLRIERFRGVAGELILDLDADAVLIEGANGTGKTTVADAIAWCLTGALPALSSRQKGELAKYDAVVSAYCRGEQARVSLTFSLAGQPFTIARSGTAESSEYRVEQFAPSGSGSHRLLEALEGGRLADWVYTVTLLRQDLVAGFATASAADRYHQMRALLGLSYLDEFEAAARSTAQRYSAETTETERVAAEALARLEDRVKRVDQALAITGPEGDQAATEQLERLRRSARPLLEIGLLPRVTPEGLTALGKQVSRLVEVTQDVLSNPHDPANRVAQARAELVAAEARLLNEDEQLRQAAAAAPWQQLANAALALLGDECPVCEATIDRASVEQRLRKLLEDSAAAASDLEAASRRIELARGEVERHSATVRRVEAAADERQQSVEAWHAALSMMPLVSMPARSHDPVDFSGVAAAAEALRTGLRRLYIEVSAPANPQDVARLEEEVTTARTAADKAKQEAAATRARAERARQLERTATRVGVSLTREALEKLDPAFDALYERMAPHPTFRELELVHDVKYRKGRTSALVRDPLAGVEINPAIAFSEGQHNALAVTLFAALALSVPDPPLPFLFLDDPLQTLDGPNALAFAELCRELRDRRQLIVTTHDRRFSALLERKLGPREAGREALFHRFEGWGPEGPTVTTRRIAGAPIPRVLAGV